MSNVFDLLDLLDLAAAQTSSGQRKKPRMTVNTRISELKLLTDDPAAAALA
jgi:hypothetical protein